MSARSRRRSQKLSPVNFQSGERYSCMRFSLAVRSNLSPRGNKYALAQKQIQPVYPRFISRAYQGQWCIAQTKAPGVIPTHTRTYIFPPLSGPVSIYFCIGVALPRLENETNLPHGFQFYPFGGDVVTTRVSRRKVRYDPRGGARSREQRVNNEVETPRHHSSAGKFVFRSTVLDHPSL